MQQHKKIRAMTDFNKFVQEQNERTKKTDSCKSQKIEYFQQMVEKFYSLLQEDWLKIDGDGLSFQKEPMEITEEQLGIYHVDKLLVTIGRTRVVFQPIGTILIGTDARIDMILNGRKVMFIRTGKNVNYASDLIDVRINGEKPKKNKDFGEVVWKFVRKNGNVSLVEATADSVQKLIMEEVNNE